MKVVHTPILIFLFALVSSIASSQTLDTIWYNKQWKQTTSSQDRFYFRTIKQINATNYEVIDHYADGSPQMTGTYSSIKPEIKNGVFSYYNEAHKLFTKRIWVDGMSAETYEYDESGKQTLHTFDVDYLKTLTAQQKKEKYDIVDIDKEVEYADGIDALADFIKKNIQYPAEAKKKNIEGRVIVVLNIDTKGRVKNTRIFLASDPLLNAEALRIVKLLPGKFIPAVDKGKVIPGNFAIPFNFMLK